MINIKTGFGFLIVSTMLSACVPATRFEWGNYESSLYAYYKSPNEKAQYQVALVRAIEQGRKKGNVAPGLCAELGFLHLEDGRLADAQRAFDEEMRLFPESKAFLTGVMQRMRPVTAAGVAS